MRSALPLAALTLAAALLLSGCVPQSPAVVPPPEPTAEPVFASDEEALAAATDAYKAYLAMSDLIAQEGGANPERIAPYVTDDALAEQLEQFSRLTTESLKSTGLSSFDSVSLQQASEIQPDMFEVAVYLCLDVSGVRLIDLSGTDVTPVPRDERLAMEVVFQAVATATPLVLAESQRWSGADYC